MTTMNNAPTGEKEIPPAPQGVDWSGPMPPADGVWRKRTTDTLPAGYIWCSDGAKVWMVASPGSPGAFVAASLVKFWMPVATPEPPPGVLDD